MSKANVAAGERPYHHGDLHRAIVSAALEVLSETQSTEFSLRELARRAGRYSQRARTSTSLTSANCWRPFRRWDSIFWQNGSPRPCKGQTSPRARLFAIARDYVRHGVENPALYRLMFGGYLTGPDDHRPAIEIAAAEKTKALLADAIAQGALGRPLPKTPRNERKIAAAILIFWSLMHGLTLLLVDRLVGPSRKDR